MSFSITQQRRSTFKALHFKKEAFIMPNPFDAGTTRILEHSGFKAIATTSAGLAFTKGYQDEIGALSLDTSLAHAQEIVAATTLPVNGDLENGYGDTPEDVAETIKGAIEVGLAGCSIEDFSSTYAARYYPLDLAIERIRTAHDARANTPDFVLTARAEAPIKSEEDLHNTIFRLNAFADAGADVVFAPELSKSEWLKIALPQLKAPLNVVATMPNTSISYQELENLGVTRISIGSALARLAYGAFLDAATALSTSADFSCFKQAPNFEEIHKLMRTLKADEPAI